MIELIVRSLGDHIEAGVVADGRLTDYLPADEGGLGEIHAGRIRRVDPALGAALVALERGDGWLDLGKARRHGSGKDLHEGAAVIVQITRPAVADKGPRVSLDLVLEGNGQRWRPLRGAAPAPGLQVLFEQIRARAAASNPPALLHASDRVRDILGEGLRLGAERIVADDHLAGLKARRAVPGDRHLDVAHEPGVWRALADQLRDALAREVGLTAGGSLLIEPTAALTVIDVNGHGRPALEIDLEAAAEIARQVRLRRIGGIVVVDFVDLQRRSERERLHTALRQAFAFDPLPVEVLPMTRLGLVQITRRRVGPSLDQLLRRPCPTCAGEGRILQPETER